jgi:hypothetical protein
MEVTILDDVSILVSIRTKKQCVIFKKIILPILTRAISHYAYSKEKSGEHYVLYVFTTSRYGGNYYKFLITELPTEKPFFNEIGFIPIEICGLCAISSVINDLSFLISGQNNDEQLIIILSGGNNAAQKVLLDLTELNPFREKQHQLHEFKFSETDLTLNVYKKDNTQSAKFSESDNQILPTSTTCIDLTEDSFVTRFDLKIPLMLQKPIERVRTIDFSKSLKLQSSFIIVEV